MGCTVGLDPENHPLRAPSFADEMPVIRIGHGSTVPYGEYPAIGLHYLEVVGCSKLSITQPASGAFRLCRFINQARGYFLFGPKNARAIFGIQEKFVFFLENNKVSLAI